MKPGSVIRVVVADDSALMRNLIGRLLSRVPDIKVVVTARDGEDAVQKAIEWKPDVVTMDINMPRLDGISAMQMILAEKICPVIMFSSLTQQGAVETFECLLDKTVIDSIGDPLTHIIRNSADHGIESKADRAQQGKPAIGRIDLSALTRGSNVIRSQRRWQRTGRGDARLLREMFNEPSAHKIEVTTWSV
jgi:chemotaxis response regulator CheB